MGERKREEDRRIEVVKRERRAESREKSCN